MLNSSYQPFWPETVVFWGAGATRNLKMLMTVDLERALYNLTQKGSSGEEFPVAERVIQALELKQESQEDHQELVDFITCLEKAEPPWSILNKYFSEERQGQQYYDYLHSQYDWDALGKLVEITPGHSVSAFKINDLYNLIDMHLFNQQGISTRIRGEQQYLSRERIVKARATLNMLVVTLQAYQYRSGLKSADYRKTMDQYQGFANELAYLMQEEGLALYHQGLELQERQFYLFSYALISMNWDPFLLWFIFMAHLRLNQNPPYIGKPATPLKLFNDMGHFMGIRKIDSSTPDLWYPLNETVAQRLNDTEHLTRRVRVGKFYFPHGSFNWRECPWCGKVIMHLGDEWVSQSESLFPPTLLPGTRRVRAACRSQKEWDAIQEGKLDAIECPYCGGITDSTNIPMVMQSSFKGNHPPFVEEIQRDMRISLEQAKHFVFLGYRLPEDDLIYRSLLAARRYSPKDSDPPYCSVVGYEENLPAAWIRVGTAEYGKYRENKIKNRSANSSRDIFDTVKQLTDIFGNPQIRIYGQGIPSVFQDPATGTVSRHQVRDLLYPRDVFLQGRVMR